MIEVAALCALGLTRGAGCGSADGGRSTHERSKPSPSSAASGSSAAPRGAPSADVKARPALPPPLDGVARAFCRDEARCAGPTAQVSVWTDASGAAKRLVWSGDLARCSHVMTWVLDEQGRELLARNDKAVSAERAEALSREWTATFEGLTEAMQTSCGELTR
jgi:hypothetical protein